MFVILRRTGLAKSKIRTLNLGKANSCLRNSSVRSPGKLPSETKEWSKASYSSRKSSEHTRAHCPPVLENKQGRQKPSMTWQGCAGQIER